MTAALAWAIEGLIASAALMALVLALRVPARRAFGAQVAYALWTLPLLRLLLPPLPEAWRGVASTPLSDASAVIAMAVLPVSLDAGTVAAPGASAFPLAAVVAGVWATGAAAFFALHLRRHARFCRTILAHSTPVDRVARVRVVESGAATGPLAFGIARPFVAFPADWSERFDADERALALAHELGHHARGDLVANWAALAVLALHWFNPVAWRAFHAFRADQELANDARVLAGRPIWQRHAYACAIVKAAHGGTVSAACHLHSIRDLKGRLQMLTTKPASRRRIYGGAASIAVLAAVTLATTASGTRATAAISETVSDTIGIDLPRTAAVVAAPAAPIAPAVPAAPPPAPAPATAPTAPQVPPVSDVPPMPAVPPAPAAPPAPRAPAMETGDVPTGHVVREGREVHRLVFHGDRASVAIHRASERAALAALRAAPEVSSANCGNPGSREMVLERSRNGRRIVVICADRIAAVSAAAATAAMDAAAMRRSALASARIGIEGARATIATSRHLSEADRREAMRDLDEGLREIEREAAAND